MTLRRQRLTRHAASGAPSALRAARLDGAPDPLLRSHSARQLVETHRGRWGSGTALFDEERRFRFRLSRVWDPSRPRVCFVMLNPSTADASRLDPTVRRCAGFATTWGAGALEVTNLFALRATDPNELRSAEAPIGEGNDEAILAGALAADLVVCGWGIHGSLGDRHHDVLMLLFGAGVQPTVLGLTKDGHPRHPLYLRGDLLPTSFPGASSERRSAPRAQDPLSS